MRLGIKAKQIGGVSLIVGLTVVALGLLYVTFMARLLVEQTSATSSVLAETVLQRAQTVMAFQVHPWAAIASDGGLRDILRSGALIDNVTSAAICNVDGVAVAAWDPGLEGTQLQPVEQLATLTENPGLAQLFDIYSYSAGAKRLEVRRSLKLGDTEFGTIRIGVHIQMVRVQLVKELWSVGAIGLVALLIAVVVSAAFAQRMLRPIHIIRTGLTRLGQGEVGVRLDLPQQDEFGELGSFFNAVSAQLSADRTHAAGQESGQAAASGPTDSEKALLNYSRKLVALGRLTAGVAHEVKNPLNAMTIHLELLRQKLGGGSGASRRRAAADGADGAGAGPPRPDMEHALEHVRIISAEIQRLDQVMQGLLKFARSEDLKPQALSLATLVDEVVGVIRPECEAAKVGVVVAGVDRVPPIMGDPTMLRQALLNLALNARQAMPDGGTLRIAAVVRPRGVEVSVEDTGVGIKPEHLGRIFDLYFTTREKGSGIGLSMVYRTVHLHDGEIEVESTEGRGTTFRLLLPRAS